MHHMHVHSCKLFKCKYKVDMIHLNSDHDIFCSTRLWGKFSKICINLPQKMHKHKTCTLAKKQRNNSSRKKVDGYVMGSWDRHHANWIELLSLKWRSSLESLIFGSMCFHQYRVSRLKNVLFWHFYLNVEIMIYILVYVLVSRSFGQNLWQLTRLAWNVNKVITTYMLFILLKEAK